ncbi:MAG: L,D-transpeptidase [Hyphomicrobium sp.]|jgi:hypothetical protein
MLTRAQATIVAAVLALVLAAQAARADAALGYLEGLKGSSESYRAPSELDPRFTVALYVNAATKGPWRQRMWVLHRDAVGGAWRLAMWDEKHWQKQKLAPGEMPTYSWPVSTGRYYPGDRFSGPTPNGVFALDERRWRYGRGYTAPGMIHTMFIDLHYTDGRGSGVAFHGTLPGRYRYLGLADSHGCIRMKQANAAALFDRVTGRDKALPEELRWGEVPRFWQTERGKKRFGYTRDGTLHAAEEPLVADLGVTQVAAHPAADPFPDVLTKTGFRAIAVIFNN